jgi:transcriptional regulator with XRE-family HTH domain
MKLNVTNFKIILARKQMNPKDLADVSGIQYNTINSWIKNTGRRNPSLKAIGKAAAALEVDVTELIEQ